MPKEKISAATLGVNYVYIIHYLPLFVKDYFEKKRLFLTRWGTK